MKKSHNIALAFFLSTGSAYSGEYALLTNGFRIHADRHETSDGKIKLYEKGGISELAEAQVTSFEAEDWTPTAKAEPAAQTMVKAEAPKGDIDMYAETAKRHGLPPALVRSIVKAESNGNSKAVSPKGAIGLMQLMPGTAKELGVDPTIPEQNVDAGTRYLKSLLAKYEDKDDQVARAVAAYNAGPGAVDKYKGVPPYRETQTYVRRVLTNYLNTKDPR